MPDPEDAQDRERSQFVDYVNQVARDKAAPPPTRDFIQSLVGNKYWLLLIGLATVIGTGFAIWQFVVR